jgi:hypothetical protein
MNNHITMPLTLIMAAVIIGAATVAVNNSSSNTPAELAMVSGASDATIDSVSILVDNAAAAGTTNARVINWETSNFPADSLVTVNLIRKISDSPMSFEMVRTIVTDVPNNSSVSWVPETSEVGDDLYIEVVCSAIQTTGGCRTNSAPIKAF